jgi:crotonobetainyl-CoA:carnitine CoA-transferase CaiB-like acyl-CoA transferase
VLRRDEILPQIRSLLAGYTRDEVIALLEGTGLPFAPIGKPEDLFDDPHLVASGLLEDVELPDGARTRLPGLPIAFDGQLTTRAAKLSPPG